MAKTRWVFVLFLLSLATGLSAQATFTVSTTADSGAGSLRQAITDANAAAGADTIQFTVTGTIALLTALPVISDSVTIDGPGRTVLTIERDSGAADFRILETGVIGTTLSINELTIRGGRAVQGAGIFSRGPTNLWDVRINDCVAEGATGGNAEGGAIYHSPAISALLVSHSLIENCHAIGGDNAAGNGGNGRGGAIFLNAGSVGLLSTTIDNCDAIGGDSTGGNGDGGTGSGGGIFARFAATLTDCIVSNCQAMAGAANGTGNNPSIYGGGLFGEGIVTSLDTTWLSNSSTSNAEAGGGAIAFEPTATQQLTVTRSVLTGNNATAGGANSNALGAAIASFGIVEIRETEFSGSITIPTGTGLGVVIFHEAASAFLMERSTVAGNNGQGVMIDGSASASIVNSTISANTSASFAGGVTSSAAAVTVTFCTITQNSGATGGGIATTVAGTITVTGSIIAQNTGGAAADADYMVATGSIFDAGGNVIGVEDAAVFNNAGTQTGTSTTPLNAMLGVLADNGGLTRTHALLTGSPAIDMGGATGVPATDQRNAPRNVGAADSGAFEFGAIVPGGQGEAGGEGDGRCSTGDQTGLGWLLLLGLLAVAGVHRRLRRA